MEIDTLVIGAGPSGLAISALLGKHNIPYTIIEKEDSVGSAWRTHYSRLHLHTVKSLSHLPMLPFPEDYPRYVPRQKLIEYLELYANKFSIQPKFSEKAEEIQKVDSKWMVKTTKDTYKVNRLIICTGYNHTPKIPEWKGMKDFTGKILHSKDYRTNSPYKGQKVLIVGAGNTGGELAIDLWEGGADVDICIRSPLHVVPREMFGIPMQITANILDKFPIFLADPISKFILNHFTIDLKKFGITKPEYGSIRQVKEKEKIPLIDIGTSELIFQEQIKVKPGIQEFDKEFVIFSDSTKEKYDSVILCTGFSANLSPLFPGLNLWNEKGYPNIRGKEFLPGLYFLGYTNHITGFLRYIGVEAKKIVKDISMKRKSK